VNAFKLDTLSHIDIIGASLMGTSYECINNAHGLKPFTVNCEAMHNEMVSKMTIVHLALLVYQNAVLCIIGHVATSYAFQCVFDYWGSYSDIFCSDWINCREISCTVILCNKWNSTTNKANSSVFN